MSSIICSLPSSSGILILNVEPFCSSLVTFIVPPMYSTSSFIIARPSPVPPLLFLASTSCVNGENKDSKKAGVIPRPVSETVIPRDSASLLFMSCVLSFTWPCSVNFNALLNKLEVIWLRRVLSQKAQQLSSIVFSMINSTWVSLNNGVYKEAKSLNMVLSSTSVGSSFNSP